MKIELRDNKSLITDTTIVEGVEVWNRNDYGRESHVGWFIKEQDKPYQFKKAPFIILSPDEQEEICWVQYNLD